MKISLEKMNAIKEVIWNNLFPLIACIFIIIFFILKNNKLLIIGFTFLFLGLYFLKIVNKFIKFYGIITICFGVILILTNFNQVLGFAGVILLLGGIGGLNFYLKKSDNKFKEIFGGILVLFLFYVAIRFSFSLFSNSIDLLFSVNFPSPLATTILLLTLFLFLIYTIFSTISYSTYIISKYISKLKKLNNPYFTVSLTIIFLILFVGIWATRVMYTHNYPKRIIFSDIPSINPYFDCKSAEGKLYHISGDFMVCEGNLIPPKNLTFGEISLWTKKSNIWNISQDQFFILKNNSLISFKLPLEKEIQSYYLVVPLINNNGEVVYAEHKEISIQSLTLEEYNQKNADSFSFLGGVFLVALFSVFSAIANLKKILEP